jgi:hypothetical protein
MKLTKKNIDKINSSNIKKLAKKYKIKSSYSNKVIANKLLTLKLSKTERTKILKFLKPRSVKTAKGKHTGTLKSVTNLNTHKPFEKENYTATLDRDEERVIEKERSNNNTLGFNEERDCKFKVGTTRPFEYKGLERDIKEILDNLSIEIENPNFSHLIIHIGGYCDYGTEYYQDNCNNLHNLDSFKIPNKKTLVLVIDPFQNKDEIENEFFKIIHLNTGLPSNSNCYLNQKLQELISKIIEKDDGKILVIDSYALHVDSLSHPYKECMFLYELYKDRPLNKYLVLKELFLNNLHLEDLELTAKFLRLNSLLNYDFFEVIWKYLKNNGLSDYQEYKSIDSFKKRKDKKEIILKLLTDFKSQITSHPYNFFTFVNFVVRILMFELFF